MVKSARAYVRVPFFVTDCEKKVQMRIIFARRADAAKNEKARRESTQIEREKE